MDVLIPIYACACNKIGVFEVTLFGREPNPAVICVGECQSLSHGEHESVVSA